MKKIYVLTLTALLFVTGGFAQVTITNPNNTTPSLAATYVSLASAITALDAITNISGPVTITLNAINPQTAPAGGYVIQFTATTSAASTITINGSNNTITAFTPQTTGSLNDAIFKLIGADYITLQNFTMQENGSNTTTGGATPGDGTTGNNMTEFGVALLRASQTDGAQNNTIQNNIISLNNTYTNTFGIYSNVRHSATAPTITLDITNVTGSNFGNKIYGNSISNVNYGVVFNGSSVAAQMDNGNDVGGSSAATGNAFTNWGSTGTAISSYVNLTGSNYCIFVNHQVNENVSYNTMTSATHTTTNTLGGILKNYSAGQPGGTITTTINNNTVTLSTSTSSGTVVGINSQGISPALSTSTITMNNNNIINCVISGVGTSSGLTGITNLSICGTLYINNNVIRSNTSTATTGDFTGISNSGAVVNTINITNNQIGNASGGAVAFSVANIGAINGIQNSGGVATTTVNINFNSIEGISAVSSSALGGQLAGISNFGNAGVAININNNSLGTTTGNFVSYSAATANNSFFGLYNGNGTATTVISISNNDIRGIVNTAQASTTHLYIFSAFAGAVQNINNNTFTNITANTTGDIYFIAKLGAMTATGVENCSNNSIVTAYNKTGAGGTVIFYISAESAVNGSTMTQTGNNFSNVTVTGTTTISGWYNQDGASNANAPTKTITGNTFSNITGGTGFINVMEIDYSGNNSSVSFNTITNINGTGQVAGIIYGSNNNQGTHAVSSNTISTLTSSGSGGVVVGIDADGTSITTLNVNANSITGLSSTGASSPVIGIEIDAGNTVNANTNIINNLSGTGTTSPYTEGITVLGGTTVGLGYNKIHTLSETGAISTTSPAVNGISFYAGTTVTAYNNFVANLNAPNANLADAIRGININSTTTLTTYNCYYNSIYINAISGGANFGTSGIYHASNATFTTAALNLIDNMIVNTSTANGTGVTAAYRRSTATLTNFAATSNYNLFYAGTPGVKNLIFYDGSNSDQTLAAYQARVSSRDANSITALPNFTSSTDLHITNANCSIDDKGTPIGGITDDIDTDTRSVTVPDIGADEFTAVNYGVLAGSAGNKVCSNKAVVNTGTTYTDGSCNLIAKIIPSGGAPVSGMINTCVTIDPGIVQYFNAEPYVQRHYDIEPATANTTTTSATITLYFTDAEFIAFNAVRVGFPPLPTSALGNADPNIANLRVTQYHGTPTTTPSSPGNYTANSGNGFLIVPSLVFWNATASRWEVTISVTGFSGFYVHTNIYPLPITFNYLNGIKQGSNHLLTWSVTCNTTPRATLSLERSADARNFSSIYSITATALRCQQPFDYSDAQPLNGMNYYRLKMTDADGKITYSNTIALLNAAKGFELMSIAPNPVTGGTFKLNATAATPTKMELVISDMMGRVVKRQTVSLIAGYNSINMNITNLAAGTYNIYGTAADDRSGVMRFVKQ